MSVSIPNLERLYECGDVLANAKGLSYKAVRPGLTSIVS